MSLTSTHALRGILAAGLAALMLMLVASPRAIAATLPITVTVPATTGDPVVGGSTGFFDSGVVLSGETVVVTASGTWAACDAGPTPGCASGPNGTPVFGTGFQPLPTSLAGALVARVGGGPWTLIGAGPASISGTGSLLFANNDGGWYGDNSGSVSVTVAASPSGTTVTVPATAGDPVVGGSTGFFNTGITLTAVQSYILTASGTWAACDAGPAPGCASGPNGTAAFGTGFQPLPTSLAGALVARVGGGPWFFVGSGPTTVTGVGALILADNDGGWYGDNSGFVTVNIVAGPPVASMTLAPPAASGIVAVPYSSALVVTGGAAPYTYSITAGALPAGLTLNASTGAITGVPTTAGVSTFTAQVVDSSSLTAGVTAVITIAVAPSFNLNVPATAGDPIVGGSTGFFPGGVTLSGGSIVVTSSGLWDACGGGCTTDGNGSAAIGTGFQPLPTAFANALVARVGSGPWVLVGVGPAVLTGTGAVVFANNDGGFYGDNSGFLTVTIAGASAPAAPVTVASPAATAQVGAAYSSAFVAGGGVPPYTYSITVGALPAGLTLNASTGALTGTPTAAGAVTFTGQVVDSALATATVISTITVAPAAGVFVNIPAVSGSLFPVSNSPIGYTSSGVTLTATQSYIVTATGTWQFCNFDPIACAPVGPGGSPTVGAGDPIPTAIGGRAGVLVARVGSGPWFAIGAGPTTVTGIGLLEFAMNDGFNYDDNLGFVTAQIVPGPPVALPVTLGAPAPTGTAGTAYSSALVASGGVPGYTYSITTGALPGGLSLNTSIGAITGTPTTAGAFTFTGKVLDSTSQIATVNATITISPPAQQYFVCNAHHDDDDDDDDDDGDHGDHRNGSPGHEAEHRSTLPIRIAICDASGHRVGSASLPVTAVSVTTGVLDDAGNSNPGNLFRFVGGGQYQYNLNTSGYAPGNYTLDFVVGSDPTVLHHPFTIRAPRPPSVHLIDAAPDGTAGVAYTGAFTATGGTAPYTFSIISGALPSGLTLNAATGAITGTPTAAGAFTLKAKVVATAGGSDTEEMKIKIEALPPVDLGHMSAEGKVGTTFSKALSVTGGSAPYTFVLTSGSLPGGLLLNASTGVISGTPAAAGTFTFKVKATGTAGGSDTEEMKIKVNP